MHLGRKLEQNLRRNSDDEICTWLAHYIAEKMTDANAANGETRASAQRDCFESILLLWEHQRSFPDQIRPFKSFDPIFSALAHIDPNKSSPSFFRNENSDIKPPEEIEELIEVITSLDSAARAIISFFVRESISQATKKSTLEWLDAIKGVVKSDEVTLILKFISELEGDDMDKKSKRSDELAENIKRLEAFESISKDIRVTLKAELEKLEAKD